jgi:outer membrane protein OmpA-like peptidoglycan-associated protein
MKTASAIALVACLTTAGVAAASSTKSVTDFADRSFSVREIALALKPVRTRGLTLNVPEEEKETPKVSLELRFKLNSAELSPEAKQRLDTVGAALNTPALEDMAIVVSGHTDATGSFEHNVELSLRRAEAVKAYLVAVHEVAPARLKTVGRGPTELLDEEHPASGVNRRVQLAVAS